MTSKEITEDFSKNHNFAIKVESEINEMAWRIRDLEREKVQLEAEVTRYNDLLKSLLPYLDGDGLFIVREALETQK